MTIHAWNVFTDLERTFGPFLSVQITYDTLRVVSADTGDQDDDFGMFVQGNAGRDNDGTPETECWVIEGENFTDFTVSA